MKLYNSQVVQGLANDLSGKQYKSYITHEKITEDSEEKFWVYTLIEQYNTTLEVLIPIDDDTMNTGLKTVYSIKVSLRNDSSGKNKVPGAKSILKNVVSSYLNERK